jgi:hypothetical protein
MEKAESLKVLLFNLPPFFKKKILPQKKLNQPRAQPAGG